jgi:peptidoglycan/LPS O-acetylase OafA/YrhL
LSASTSRLPLADALKAVAAQLIVLHHLAFYGPVADAAMELAPTLISWFAHQARLAVQVFLVVGGFLAARKLAPRGVLIPASPPALVWRRYLKLAVPYVAALVLSFVCAALARLLMSDDSIPAAPTVPQFIAHVLLLQDILGFEALSAGIWYVAIDFQLFILLLSGLWMTRQLGAGFKVKTTFSLLLVASIGIASLFHFNRNAAWDPWALYFFASYSLGVLAYWASERGRSPAWLGLMAAVVALALLADFRSRIAVALAVAMVLGWARRTGFLESWPKLRPIVFLGRISYSVFLVHFPVCLVVNALFNRLAPGNPAMGVIGMLLAWATSNAAGALFFRHVEAPVVAWNWKPADPMLKQPGR